MEIHSHDKLKQIGQLVSPLIIGHRGTSALAPENTLAAFRLSQQQGADGIEFDVQLTSDGVPVVIHDFDLRRTGSLSKLVSEVTLKEIRNVDVGSWFNHNQFSGEKVPTLDEVFDLFDGTDAVLYLEMKSETNRREQLAKRCCELISESPLKPQVIVECFDHDAIKLVTSIDPEIKTAALFEPNLSTLPLSILGSKIINRALAVSADQIALHHKLARPAVIQKAHHEGLDVAVWTVDDPKWIEIARRNKISALITNNPGALISERDRATSD